MALRFEQKLVVPVHTGKLVERSRVLTALQNAIADHHVVVVAAQAGWGKTTLLALILSDHPQAYAQPIKLFGKSRLAEAGQPAMSLFDIQRRIGHCSPEVHSFFPKHLTVRQAIESAYADAPLARPRLDAEADMRVTAALRWFQGELNPALGMDPELKAETLNAPSPGPLPYAKPMPSRLYRIARAEYWQEYKQKREAAVEWADHMLFSDMTYTGQRVALFLRAIIAEPDIVILDEAFSGMDDFVRDRCLLFLEHGETRRLSPFVESPQRLATRWKGVKRLQRCIQGGLAFESGITDQQALIVVSHVREEIPSSTKRFLWLPEAGSRVIPRSGTIEIPLFASPRLWGTIWGMHRSRKTRAGFCALYYPD